MEPFPYLAVQQLRGVGVEPFPYLAVQQLRLRAPGALDLIADAVEESDPKLLPVAPAELAQHLPRPLCNGTAQPRQARAGAGV